MNPQRLYRLARKAVMAWMDDFAPSMGAAIAYYTVFSIAPLLVIVIAVAGALFGREAVQGDAIEYSYQVKLLDPSFHADLLDALRAVEDISDVNLLMHRATVEI